MTEPCVCGGDVCQITLTTCCCCCHFVAHDCCVCRQWVEILEAVHHVLHWSEVDAVDAIMSSDVAIRLARLYESAGMLRGSRDLAGTEDTGRNKKVNRDWKISDLFVLDECCIYVCFSALPSVL